MKAKVYKCPLEKNTNIDVGDIVIGQNGKIYMLIAQKRTQASRMQKYGCNACIFHEDDSLHCKLKTNIIFSIKHEKAVIRLTDCFQIIDEDILLSNYVSFVELSSGGV